MSKYPAVNVAYDIIETYEELENLRCENECLKEQLAYYHERDNMEVQGMNNQTGRILNALVQKGVSNEQPSNSN